MSRTFHHGERGRRKKFGDEFSTSSIKLWTAGSPFGQFIELPPTRVRMKWPSDVDRITAQILGYKIIETPPKRKKHTWHYVWMLGSRGRGKRSKSYWFWLHFTRPERADVRALLRKVLHLTDIEDAPLFPVSRKPHNYYW